MKMLLDKHLRGSNRMIQMLYILTCVWVLRTPEGWLKSSILMLKRRFQQAFGVHSTQMLIKIFNIQLSKCGIDCKMEAFYHSTDA